MVKFTYLGKSTLRQVDFHSLLILLDKVLGPSKYLVVILTPIIALHTPNFTVRYNFSDFFISRFFVIRESRENKKVVKISGFTAH